MKRITKVALLLILSIIMITVLNGCSRVSAYQKGIYDKDKEIVKQNDSATFFKRIGNTTNDTLAISFSSFSGMESLWSIKSKGDNTLTIDYDLDLDKGRFKCVLITPDDEVINIFEDEDKDNKTIELPEGKSRIKIVGKEAKGKVAIAIVSMEDVNIQEID